MVFAYTINLEILAVQPKTSLCIELKIAKARNGLHLVDHTATHNQLSLHAITVGIVARPLVRFTDVGLTSVGIQPHISDRDSLVGGILIVDLHLAIVHINTPMLHMDGMSGGKPHMTVNATTAIPA